MKLKFIGTVIFLSFASLSFSQDTLKPQKQNKITFKNDPVLKSTIQPANSYTDTSYIIIKKKPMYRPTRLGSSSPLYNTYRKNKYGAGSITTNPHKGQGNGIPVKLPPPRIDTIYR